MALNIVISNFGIIWSVTYDMMVFPSALTFCFFFFCPGDNILSLKQVMETRTFIYDMRISLLIFSENDTRCADIENLLLLQFVTTSFLFTGSFCD